MAKRKRKPPPRTADVRHMWTGFNGLGGVIPESTIAVTPARAPRIRPPGREERALLRLGTSADRYSCNHCGTKRLFILGQVPFAWLDDGFKSALWLMCSDNCAKKYVRKMWPRNGRVGRC
jgi:hypothetical protein